MGINDESLSHLNTVSTRHGPGSVASKVGILMANLGGPDSLKAVKPFLYNLFADPHIFNIPFGNLIQKPLAWLICTLRDKSSQANYALIGGKSPILELTQAQAAALQAELAQRGIEDIPIEIGMRYSPPFTEDALDNLQAKGVTHCIVLPMYPQYSTTTTESSYRGINLWQQNNPSMVLTRIETFYEHPQFIEAWAKQVQTGLDENAWSCPKEEVLLLFCAHSLPISVVKKKKDPYPEQIEATREAIASLHFPNNAHQLSFQSKVGPVPWLSPSVEETLEQLHQEKRDNILLIPISFVSDHVETLYELDCLYLPMAEKLGIKNCYRAPSLNLDPLFIQTLADVVVSHAQADGITLTKELSYAV